MVRVQETAVEQENNTSVANELMYISCESRRTKIITLEFCYFITMNIVPLVL